MKGDQKGFGVLGIIVVIVVVIAIGAVGWLVNDRKKNENNKQPATQNEIAFTDCHTEVDKVSKKLDNGDELYEWTTVEHTQVVLSDWGVTLTLPESLVGKAVCRYTSNGYEFSTKSIVNDPKCVRYYRSDELRSESVQLWKYLGTTAAEGQISGASGTLDDYYKAHKASDGNFFTDPSAGRNYYKVGDNFYVAFGDANGTLSKYKAARTAACKNEMPDYDKAFVTATASLKQR